MRLHRFPALLLATILAVAPAVAMACACCGQADTWSVQQVARDGHEWRVLERLRPGPGEVALFDTADAGDDTLDVTAVARDGDAWRFRTDKGELVFRSGPALERRLVDARLIRGDGPGARGMVPIYQELVLPGALTLPGGEGAEAVAVPAHLVLRAVAGMCVDAENFSGWLLRSEGGPVRASASGGMLAPAAAD